MSALSLLFSRSVMTNFFETPWTIAHQSPLSMGFPRQEYWSGLPFPSLGYLPLPGIEPVSPALAGGFFSREPGESPCLPYFWLNSLFVSLSGTQFYKYLFFLVIIGWWSTFRNFILIFRTLLKLYIFCMINFFLHFYPRNWHIFFKWPVRQWGVRSIIWNIQGVGNSA